MVPDVAGADPRPVCRPEAAQGLKICHRSCPRTGGPTPDLTGFQPGHSVLSHVRHGGCKVCARERHHAATAIQAGCSRSFFSSSEERPLRCNSWPHRCGQLGAARPPDFVTDRVSFPLVPLLPQDPHPNLPLCALSYP